MSWCDVVTLPDGSFGKISVTASTVSLLGHWTATAPEPLGFCRAASTFRGVLTIHQGQSGTAWLIGEHLRTDLGPTFGVQPVAIDALFIYIVRSNTALTKIALKDFAETSVPHGAPGSSQGISDIAPDGTLWWADQKRTISVHGTQLTYPNVKGAIAVGQADPPQIRGVVSGSPKIHFTAYLGDAFEPHLAVSGDRFIVCARTAHGSWFGEFPPFPALVDGTPPPPVVSPPVPPPLPVMPLAPNVFPTIQEVFALHPEINTKEDGTRGKMTDEVVRALGGKPWGRKDRDQDPLNHNNSDDALCYLLRDGRFEIYDIISGVDGSPSWDYKGTFANGENGYFREVTGTVVRPSPPSTPSFDPVPFLSALANLTAQIDSLRMRVKELEQKPFVLPKLRAVGSTRNMFGHQHRVEIDVVEGR